MPPKFTQSLKPPPEGTDINEIRPKMTRASNSQPHANLSDLSPGLPSTTSKYQQLDDELDDHADSNPSSTTPPPKNSEDELRSKVTGLNYDDQPWWGIFFLTWLSPLINLGKKFNLTLQDVPLPPSSNRTSSTFPTWTFFWTRAVRENQEIWKEDALAHHKTNNTPISPTISNQLNSYDEYVALTNEMYAEQINHHDRAQQSPNARSNSDPPGNAPPQLPPDPFESHPAITAALQPTKSLRNEPNPWVLKELSLAFLNPLMVSALGELLYYVFSLIQPYCIKKLSLYFNEYRQGADRSLSTGLYWAVLLGVISIMTAVMTIVKHHAQVHLSTRQCSALLLSVYEKTLRIASYSLSNDQKHSTPTDTDKNGKSNNGDSKNVNDNDLTDDDAKNMTLLQKLRLKLQHTNKLEQQSPPTRLSTGMLTNLLSNDTMQTYNTAIFFHFIWSNPLAILVSLILMYWDLGSAAIVTMLLMLTLIPYQFGMATIVRHYRKKVLALTDDRIKYISQLLSGIRVIKVYAWEKVLSAKLGEYRSRELSMLKILALWCWVAEIISFIYPLITTYLTLWIYIKISGELSTETVFLILAYLNTVRHPIQFLSTAFQAVIDFHVSSSRIGYLLGKEEIPIPQYQAENVLLANVGVRIDKNGEVIIDYDKIREFQDEHPHETHIYQPQPWESHFKRSIFNRSKIQKGRINTRYDQLDHDPKPKHNPKSVRFNPSTEILPITPVSKHAALNFSDSSLNSSSSSSTSVSDSTTIQQMPQQPRPAPLLTLSNIDLYFSSFTQTPLQSPVLANVSFDLSPGQLVSIIGYGGKGKSAFISAILGELYPQFHKTHHGLYSIPNDPSKLITGLYSFNNSIPIVPDTMIDKKGHTIAYCAQHPWLINDTLRNNILMGKAFNEERYLECIIASALEADLDIFPLGDFSIVSDGGLSLSGGQLARVAFARLLYHAEDVDIVILDDIFAAVDAYVAKTMFFKGVMKMLCFSDRGVKLGKPREKLGILMTLNSHYDFLQYCSEILIIDTPAPWMTSNDVRQNLSTDSVKNLCSQNFGLSGSAISTTPHQASPSSPPLSQTYSNPTATSPRQGHGLHRNLHTSTPSRTPGYPLYDPYWLQLYQKLTTTIAHINYVQTQENRASQSNKSQPTSQSLLDSPDFNSDSNSTQHTRAFKKHQKGKHAKKPNSDLQIPSYDESPPFLTIPPKSHNAPASSMNSPLNATRVNRSSSIESYGNRSSTGGFEDSSEMTYQSSIDASYKNTKELDMYGVGDTHPLHQISHTPSNNSNPITTTISHAGLTVPKLILPDSGAAYSNDPNLSPTGLYGQEVSGFRQPSTIVFRGSLGQFLQYNHPLVHTIVFSSNAEWETYLFSSLLRQLLKEHIHSHPKTNPANNTFPPSQNSSHFLSFDQLLQQTLDKLDPISPSSRRASSFSQHESLQFIAAELFPAAILTPDVLAHLLSDHDYLAVQRLSNSSKIGRVDEEMEKQQRKQLEQKVDTYQDNKQNPTNHSSNQSQSQHQADSHSSVVVSINNTEESNSSQSSSSTDARCVSKSDNDERKVISTDSKAPTQATIPNKLYLWYLRGSRGVFGLWFVLTLLIILSIASQGIRTWTDLWIVKWAEDSSATVVDPKPLSYWLLTTFYGMLASFVLFVGQILIFVYCQIDASKHFHDVSAKTILHSVVGWLDTTPMGTILNYMTKDIEVVDYTLPDNLLYVVQQALMLLGILILSVITSPLFIIPLVPIFILLWYIRQGFHLTSVQLKRIESASLQPIYSLFNSSLTGVATIRAYSFQNHFLTKFRNLVDNYIRVKVIATLLERRFGFYLNCIAGAYIGLLAVLVVFFRDHINTNSGMLAITYSLRLIGSLQVTIRFYTLVTSSMTSIHRLYNLNMFTPQESEFCTSPEANFTEVLAKQPKEWHEYESYLVERYPYLKRYFAEERRLNLEKNGWMLKFNDNDYIDNSVNVYRAQQLDAMYGGSEESGWIGKTMKSLFDCLDFSQHADEPHFSQQDPSHHSNDSGQTSQRDLQQHSAVHPEQLTVASPIKSLLTRTTHQLDHHFWPWAGKIEFKNVSIRYRPELPIVLNNLSVTILPGQHTGIVAKTGSGKSTLFLSLMRLLLPESGHIEIDGVDTSKLGLGDLRSRISIIPQLPTLFQGTIRYNLDPTGKFTDEELMCVLDWVQLRSKVIQLARHSNTPASSTRNSAANSPTTSPRAGIHLDDIPPRQDSPSETSQFLNDSAGLYAMVNESGSNFSASERQLLCIARALLSQPNISITDPSGLINQPQLPEPNPDKYHVKSHHRAAHQRSPHPSSPHHQPTTFTSLSYQPYANSEYEDFSNPSHSHTPYIDPESAQQRTHSEQQQVYELPPPVKPFQGSILLADEITSTIDPASDEMIQATLRAVFSRSTILIIAHRLQTIIDLDRILVLKPLTENDLANNVTSLAEHDHPFVLLSDPTSTFFNMCLSTGVEQFIQLYYKAKDGFYKTVEKEVKKYGKSLIRFPEIPLASRIRSDRYDLLICPDGPLVNEDSDTPAERVDTSVRLHTQPNPNTRIDRDDSFSNDPKIANSESILQHKTRLPESVYFTLMHTLADIPIPIPIPIPEPELQLISDDIDDAERVLTDVSHFTSQIHPPHQPIANILPSFPTLPTLSSGQFVSFPPPPNSPPRSTAPHHNDLSLYVSANPTTQLDLMSPDSITQSRHFTTTRTTQEGQFMSLQPTPALPTATALSNADSRPTSMFSRDHQFQHDFGSSDPAMSIQHRNDTSQQHPTVPSSIPASSTQGSTFLGADDDEYMTPRLQEPSQSFLLSCSEEHDVYHDSPDPSDHTADHRSGYNVPFFDHQHYQSAPNPSQSHFDQQSQQQQQQQQQQLLSLTQHNSNQHHQPVLEILEKDEYSFTSDGQPLPFFETYSDTASVYSNVLSHDSNNVNNNNYQHPTNPINNNTDLRIDGTLQQDSPIVTHLASRPPPTLGMRRGKGQSAQNLHSLDKESR